MEEDSGNAPLVVDWAQVKGEGSKPVPRGGHSAVAVESNLVIFGGHAYSGNGKFEYFNDTHLFDGETGMWHNVQCSGELPQPRYGHSVTLVGNRMFLFGGKGAATLFRDIFFLDLEEWAWVPVSSTSQGPSPRLNHASLLVGRKMVIHGGWDGGKRCLDDLWVFDTDSFQWMNPRTAGSPPSPRYGHSMQLLNDGRIMLFGGITVKEGEIPKYQSDLRQLDTESMVWSKPRAHADVHYPSGRYAHSFTQIGSQLVLFGGWGLGGLQNSEENKRPGASSFFAYDIESSSWWIPPMPLKPLEHKYGHTATVMGDTLFIFGGWSGKQATNSLVQIALQPG